MDWLIFGFPGNEPLAAQLAEQLQIPVGQATIRAFPDGESYVRLLSEVQNKNVLIVLTLDHPNDKFLPLFFFCQTAREAGARKIGLVAPYLAYMRQDKQFNPGEAVTSRQFAKLLSSVVDLIVTIDPHLHRVKGMEEIYSVPVTVLHAAPLLSAWVIENVKNPLLVGPDSESEQWVRQVAQAASAPYLVLEKHRKGDREVEIKVPPAEGWEQHQPILVDDIISTARTMIMATQQLITQGFQPPICLGIHPIFSDNSFEESIAAGAAKIITCDTISHPSNGIKVAPLLEKALVSLLRKA
ncbi:phosphoribosylpyrophosphate synthetase [Rufibacter radiotolerans]|uniref:ribose-phosphate diphosphokinase n=1 Tax=Rufibacter radiotolerans TaxID=1379910 RepID=A0A0H4VKB0_9BACT|nr:ribose-phosphate pyrophosphokinase [Rufibacter radiotolerans]AKQ45788.1 phosphoribosylpyrophosphate synthetase [Rufibacter radiotolerans]